MCPRVLSTMNSARNVVVLSIIIPLALSQYEITMFSSFHKQCALFRGISWPSANDGDGHDVKEELFKPRFHTFPTASAYCISGNSSVIYEL